jgi:hypothetical protein
VGPSAKIQEIASQNRIDLGRARIVDAPHSHGSAAAAVALVRKGEAELLMKGSLHTDELLGAVVARETGLRTGRRLSHVFIMDVPTYHKVLVVTDAAINIAPTLEEKADICQNAIDLAVQLGVSRPKVAILAAVETVTSKMPSTIDAAALCKMAERGQITGALLDGPLAFDNAISREAAATKKIIRRSPATRHSWRQIWKRGTFSPAADVPGQRTAPVWSWRSRADHPDEPRRQRASADRELRRGALRACTAAVGAGGGELAICSQLSTC